MITPDMTRKALDQAIRRIRNARTAEDLYPDWPETDRALAWAIKSARRRQGRLSQLARADLEVIRTEVVDKLLSLIADSSDPEVREWCNSPGPGSMIGDRPNLRHPMLIANRAWKIRAEFRRQPGPENSHTNIDH